ncbi:MAG: acyl carrier protein [Steroidobacteraceae bacterium]
MTTLQILQDILVKEYRVAPDQVKPDATLTTLGLDSLSLIELMFKIEDTFKITIDTDGPTGLVTVSDVVNYIDGLLAQPGG